MPVAPKGRSSVTAKARTASQKRAAAKPAAKPAANAADDTKQEAKGCCVTM